MKRPGSYLPGLFIIKPHPGLPLFKGEGETIQLNPSAMDCRQVTTRNIKYN